MNNQSVVTLTFGDQAENHAGMEKLGELVKEGDGFQLNDLQMVQTTFQEMGAICQLISLDLTPTEQEQITCSSNNKKKSETEAYVLVIKDAVNIMLRNCSDFTQQDMFEEHVRLELDKKAWMRGKVVNKHARWNLCFDEESREPNYEEKKGRIVGYSEIPVTQALMSQMVNYFGPKAQQLKGEGNYYYDTNKCGIGFHGDSERRKVIGIRLGCGESMPMHYQWFRESIPVGERRVIPLNSGDIYVMSEKAVGTDWKKKKIFTLRHATGCNKYTTI
jgi:hypothetical protein